MTIEKAQLVTVPVIDARFATVNARIESGFAAVIARIDSGFAAVNARIDAFEAKVDATLQRWARRMVITMLLGQAALGPVGMGVFNAVRRVLSTILH